MAPDEAHKTERIGDVRVEEQEKQTKEEAKEEEKEEQKEKKNHEKKMKKYKSGNNSFRNYISRKLLCVGFERLFGRVWRHSLLMIPQS